MVEVDTKQLREMEADLKAFAHRAYPFATKQTVNKTAFHAQFLAKRNVREKMVTRNKFTERSVQVKPTRTLNVRQQESVMGSTAPYMEDQEFGGTKRKTGKHGVAIQTSYSARLGERTRPRTKLATRANKIQNIMLNKRLGRRTNRKQQNAIAVRQAAKSGSKYIYMNLGRRKGIFKVVGGQRRPRVKMVADLSNTTVQIPRTPTIIPAAIAAGKRMPSIYFDALRFQLKRSGMKRWK